MNQKCVLEGVCLILFPISSPLAYPSFIHSPTLQQNLIRLMFSCISPQQSLTYQLDSVNNLIDRFSVSSLHHHYPTKLSHFTQKFRVSLFLATCLDRNFISFSVLIAPPAHILVIHISCIVYFTNKTIDTFIPQFPQSMILSIIQLLVSQMNPLYSNRAVVQNRNNLDQVLSRSMLKYTKE